MDSTVRGLDQPSLGCAIEVRIGTRVVPIEWIFLTMAHAILQDGPAEIGVNKIDGDDVGWDIGGGDRFYLIDSAER